MKSITIELSEEYYTAFEKLSQRCGKTVEGYAKQTIENKLDVFRTVGSSCFERVLFEGE